MYMDASATYSIQEMKYVAQGAQSGHFVSVTTKHKISTVMGAGTKR